MNKVDKSNNTFWVTNVSKMDVSLADLNLTIRSMATVNLLDGKHYYLTEDQLRKSSESGSIYKKRDRIIVRKVAPVIEKKPFITSEIYIKPSQVRSGITVGDKEYTELEVSDDDFASENANLAIIDHAPLLARDEDKNG